MNEHVRGHEGPPAQAPYVSRARLPRFDTTPDRLTPGSPSMRLRLSALWGAPCPRQGIFPPNPRFERQCSNLASSLYSADARRAYGRKVS